MESGDYPDSPMQQQHSEVSEERQTVGGDSWESSYIIDVLIYSGLEDFNPDTLDLSTWHSPECPIGPWVFDSLEMKYNDERTEELKSERRFLFDRMNAVFLEIFQKYLNNPLLLQPTIVRVSEWQKEGIKEYMLNLLVREGHRVDRKIKWLELGDFFDNVGEDTEKMLMDELIEEVVAMLCIRGG